MPEEQSFADSIFSGLGGLIDGAKSVYGDILEYKLLSQEIEAQQAGVNTTSSNAPSYNTAAPSENVSTNPNQNLMLYAALGLSALATLFVFVKG